MKRLAVWAAVWTLFVVAFLLFLPGDVNSVGCWRLIDAPPECLAQLKALQDEQWWTRTLPMLVVLSSGYVVIGAAMARSWVRSRHRAG